MEQAKHQWEEGLTQLAGESVASLHLLEAGSTAWAEAWRRHVVVRGTFLGNMSVAALLMKDPCNSITSRHAKLQQPSLEDIMGLANCISNIINAHVAHV